MNKYRFNFKHMTGQSLVIFVVISTVLIGFLALGVDYGLTVTQRRAAQNAADAGALAGARELCSYNDPSIAYNNAYNRAVEYAQTKNQVPNNTWTTTPIINLNAASVKVTVNSMFNTIVAGFFGQPTMSVAATATAACLPPGTGKGVLPVAWRCYQINAMGQLDPDCDIQYINQGATCTPGTNTVYVFIDADGGNGDPKEKGTGTMYDCYQNPNPIPGAKLLNCDYNGDGNIDVKLIDNMNPTKPWFWVDLEDKKGGGAAILDQWITQGYNKTLPIHTWLRGVSGMKSSVYADVNSRSGDELALPVFDETCADDPQSVCPGKWHTGLDQTYAAGSSNPYFHLITFAIFHVNCADKNGGSGKKGCGNNSVTDFLKSAKSPYAKLDKNDKTIEGCFVEGTISGLGGSPSGGINAGAFVLYLTH